MRGRSRSCPARRRNLLAQPQRPRRIVVERQSVEVRRGVGRRSGIRRRPDPGRRGGRTKDPPPQEEERGSRGLKVRRAAPARTRTEGLPWSMAAQRCAAMVHATEPQLALDARALLGEGAIWNAALQRLHWLDIEARRVFTYDPVTGKIAPATSARWLARWCRARGGGSCWRCTRVSPTLDPASGQVRLLPPRRNTTRRWCGSTTANAIPPGRFWAGTIALVKGPKLAG